MGGSHSLRLRILVGQDTAMGPGKADLLEALGRTGSISAAARSLGMSYRRAWLLVDTMNQCFPGPLVEKVVGGEGGGGARVTRLGEEVLRRYRDMERKAGAAIADELADFEAMLGPPPGAAP
ncbi:LysR family transcriptional regulator [Ectothiorhodospiraceae bacterium 2226]|nr:LysR family transcriptional regulator [Ectothiorhodospiraceae bacterium 2226]